MQRLVTMGYERAIMEAFPQALQDDRDHQVRPPG